MVATDSKKEVKAVPFAKKPKPVGDMPIHLANLEIIENDPLPGRGDYNQGSIWDHLILRLEAKFTQTDGAGPSCVLAETDGGAFTSRARFLGYTIATKIVANTREIDKNNVEIKKTGKMTVWLKSLPTYMNEVSKQVPTQND